MFNFYVVNGLCILLYTQLLKCNFIWLNHWLNLVILKYICIDLATHTHYDSTQVNGPTDVWLVSTKITILKLVAYCGSWWWGSLSLGCIWYLCWVACLCVLVLRFLRGCLFVCLLVYLFVYRVWFIVHWNCVNDGVYIWYWTLGSCDSFWMVP